MESITIMRKVLIIYTFVLILGIILSGCKSKHNSNCDAYGLVTNDTVEYTTEHIHYDNKCHEGIVVKTVVTDTNYLYSCNF